MILVIQNRRNKVPCKYCRQPIDPRGMPSHVHFKHSGAVLNEFRMNWMVSFFMEDWPPRFHQKQLTTGDEDQQ